MFGNFAGKMSNLKHVSSGVPQGSMLGFTLFLIYVNTVANFLHCQ